MKIPCRYVRGYLCPMQDKWDRSVEGASHASVETLLPGIGWTGFDPTNDLETGDRHIRTAVGRDYVDAPAPEQELISPPVWREVQEPEPADDQQQQQQQQ